METPCTDHLDPALRAWLDVVAELGRVVLAAAPIALLVLVVWWFR